MKTSKMIIAALLAAVFATSCGNTLTLLHLNDTHSHLDPVHSGKAGVIERAAFIDSVRTADGDRNVLLLHAGDFNQGSSYFTILGGELEVSVVNALGYDCIALGNHEFDNGIENLLDRLSRIDCPVVCANYDFSSFDGGDRVQPYAIIKKAGMKIGIIGLLCDLSSVVKKSTSDRIPHLGSNEDVVNKWAAYLRNEEKCDLVIALTHIGYQEDCDMASKLHGVDVIVGGHSHTNVKKPALVTDLDGKQVTVVTDGSWGYNIGVLRIRKK